MHKIRAYFLECATIIHYTNSNNLVCGHTVGAWLMSMKSKGGHAEMFGHLCGRGVVVERRVVVVACAYNFVAFIPDVSLS